MKRLVAASIVVLSSAPVYFLFTPPASASEVVTVCKPVTSTNIVRNGAAHAAAYEDGFGEGRQSASRGETYERRSVGGEFARGFEDGYFGRRFTGQEYVVRDRVQTYTTQQCQSAFTNNPKRQSTGKSSLPKPALRQSTGKSSLPKPALRQSTGKSSLPKPALRQSTGKSSLPKPALRNLQVNPAYLTPKDASRQ